MRGNPLKAPSGVVLAGMDAQEVNVLLGEPHLQRMEKPAEYRHYDFGECSLDLFLYKDKVSGRHRVAYWEVRSSDLERSPRCTWLSERLGADPGELSDELSH